MAFWTRFPAVERDPIFKLLQEFDNVRGSSRSSSSVRAFQPNFDVTETKDAYELHGELPGIDQKDVEIEFVDRSTIKISGHLERSFTKGTPPTGFIERESQGQITAGEHHTKPHSATVEDADAPTETAVKKQEKQERPEQQQNEEEDVKYWVSERSVGEFHRSFSFPNRVDQDNVRASMKNGILSIVVPKLAEQQTRKIAIQ